MYWQWMLPAPQLVAETRKSRKALVPAADILDDGDGYQLILELPGVRQQDLTLSMESPDLLVRATRGERNESAKLLHDGRQADLAFERRFTIGAEIDRGRVTARLENGLLHVTLPRLAEEKRRVIPVDVQEASV